MIYNHDARWPYTYTQIHINAPKQCTIKDLPLTINQVKMLVKMCQQVHNCSQGVSTKNYEPCIEKSDWSIQIELYNYSMVELHTYIYNI